MFPDATLESELMALVKTQVRSLDFKRNVVAPLNGVSPSCAYSCQFGMPCDCSQGINTAGHIPQTSSVVIWTLQQDGLGGSEGSEHRAAHPPAVCGVLEQSSCEALSCWVRMVAEARDKNRDTREGGSTASVPPLKSNQKRGESYLVLRLVCAPVSWPLFPGVLGVWAALASGLLFRFCLLVWSRRVVLALLRHSLLTCGHAS